MGEDQQVRRDGRPNCWGGTGSASPWPAAAAPCPPGRLHVV